MADLKISALTVAATPLAGTEVLPIVQSSTTKQVSVANLTAGRAVSMQSITANNTGLGTPVANFESGDQSASRVAIINNGAGGQTYHLVTGNPGVSNSGFALYDSTNSATRLYVGSSTGDLTLATGNLVVASGKGIDFSATSGSGTSELLADYEEGTWTPSLTGSTSGSATSGGNTYGNYTKVGRLVTLNFVITISAVSTLTGNVNLSGLPFNLAAGGAFENRYPQGATIFGSLGTLWASIVIGSDGGTTTLAFTGTKIPATGTTNVTAADLTATSFFAGSIQYIA
jgi:hypothetical protein